MGDCGLWWNTGSVDNNLKARHNGFRLKVVNGNVGNLEARSGLGDSGRAPGVQWVTLEKGCWALSAKCEIMSRSLEPEGLG